jgi:hypothetical protein
MCLFQFHERGEEDDDDDDGTGASDFASLEAAVDPSNKICPSLQTKRYLFV